MVTNFFFEIEPSITRMKMGSDRGGAQIDSEGEGVEHVLACKIVVIIYCNLQAALLFMLDIIFVMERNGLQRTWFCKGRSRPSQV